MNKNIEIYVTGESDKKFFNDFNDNFHIKYLTNCEHKLENIDFLNPYFYELTGLFYREVPRKIPCFSMVI